VLGRGSHRGVCGGRRGRAHYTKAKFVCYANDKEAANGSQNWGGFGGGGEQRN